MGKIKINRKNNDSCYTRIVSKLSYDDIIDKLPQARKEVFDVIKRRGEVSNEEIAEELKKYPHQITPRTGELRDLGLVEISSIGKSHRSKKSVCRWRVKPYQGKIIFIDA